MLQYSSGLSPPEIRLRALAGYNFAVAIIFALATRVRILLIAPLKPENPAAWLFTGILQALAVSAVICILTILIFRGRWANVGRAVFIAINIILTAASLVIFEAIGYFGHGLHAENVGLGFHPRMIAGSAEGGVALRMAITLVCYIAAILFVNWRAGHATSTWVTVPRLSPIVAAGIASTLTMPYVHLSETSRSSVVQLLGLVRERSERSHGYIAVPPPTIPVTDIRELMPARHQQFLDDRYPLAYVPPARSAKAPRLPHGVTPNVVIILVETFRAHEVGAYGSDIPGMTPNFDALARKSFVVDNVYSTGGYTPEGELGVWYGLLASPYEIVIRNRPEARLSGLPEMLAGRGYNLLWAHPGDQTFYVSSRFYEHRAFQVSDGTSFPPDEPRTNWGYSDKALVRRAIALFNRTEEPFAAMALTVSNHHPYQLPSDASPFPLRLPLSQQELQQLNTTRWFGQRLTPMLRTIHYSDEALGDFFRMAEGTNWFKNTIFVVVGDHGCPVPPIESISSDHQLANLRHQVAMLIYSPLLNGSGRIAGPASQADIEPTIAGLLGITAPRAGVGVDLFDPADRDQDRPVISWTPESHIVTINTRDYSYHATVGDLGENPAQFNHESLIDRRTDPDGMNNLVDALPKDLERFRRLSRVYVEIYPHLIATGHSGLPPLGSRKVQPVLARTLQ